MRFFISLKQFLFVSVEINFDDFFQQRAEGMTNLNKIPNNFSDVVYRSQKRAEFL